LRYRYKTSTGPASETTHQNYRTSGMFVTYPVVSLSKKLYPYCLVRAGSSNGFKREDTIKLK